MKLIVGLGNPGREYSGNRHNIGFMCLSYFAKKYGIELDKKQSKARVGKGFIEGIEVALARPQTYMNASGESVKLLMQRYKADLDDLIVIHDDMDLPVGKLRIRLGGSSAGHKGINSIIANIGNPDFVRVRVGIGRPVEIGEDDVIDHVLGDFDHDEKRIISEIIPRVSEALLCLLTDGLPAAMNKFN